MELRPGLRLQSTTCDTQVVVVKAPASDVDVRCGGEPMVELGSEADRLPVSTEGDPTLLGKRYAEEALGLELLCTQGGHGTLSIAATPLTMKGAKPLPSSD